MNDYIRTYSGIHFYPLAPVKEDINIGDIAHSLSLMTRANGHLAHFYSVAQHSINCGREAMARGLSARIALAGLLHDASESYLSDLTRPVKKHFKNYYDIEEKLQRMIYEAFDLDGLSQEEEEIVREIDDTMLYHEFRSIMNYRIFDTEPPLAMPDDFVEKNFRQVEEEFLALFHVWKGGA
ncbi:MAG: phosphohydrolase [Clostridia bacterium]